MPMRARTATPPITAPTMSPIDGPELLDDAAAREEVDCAGDCDCEFELDVVALLIKEDWDGEGALLVVTLDTVVSEAEFSVADVVDADGAMDWTTLPIALVMTAVGIVTPLLDKTEVTWPTMLDRMLPICLPCNRCLRCTMSTPMLPAARQYSLIRVFAIMRSVFDGEEACSSKQLIWTVRKCCTERACQVRQEDHGKREREYVRRPPKILFAQTRVVRRLRLVLAREVTLNRRQTIVYRTEHPYMLAICSQSRTNAQLTIAHPQPSPPQRESVPSMSAQA